MCPDTKQQIRAFLETLADKNEPVFKVLDDIVDVSLKVNGLVSIARENVQALFEACAFLFKAVSQEKFTESLKLHIPEHYRPIVLATDDIMLDFVRGILPSNIDIFFDSMPGLLLLKGRLKNSSPETSPEDPSLLPTHLVKVVQDWVASALMGIKDFVMPRYAAVDGTLLETYKFGASLTGTVSGSAIAFDRAVDFFKPLIQQLFPNVAWLTVKKLAPSLEASGPWNLLNFYGLGLALRWLSHPDFTRLKTHIATAIIKGRSRILFFPKSRGFPSLEDHDYFLRLTLGSQPGFTCPDHLHIGHYSSTDGYLIKWSTPIQTGAPSVLLPWASDALNKLMSLGVGDQFDIRVGPSTSASTEEIKEQLDLITRSVSFKFSHTIWLDTPSLAFFVNFRDA